eukprot:11286965-Alexandrium_andersonii.AAC.1
MYASVSLPVRARDRRSLATTSGALLAQFTSRASRPGVFGFVARACCFAITAGQAATPGLASN